MDCNKVKEIIPKYFNHTASEEEIKAVEEHLCICHECRTALGELMDKDTGSEQPVEKEPQAEEMQIIPGNMPETPLGEQAETVSDNVQPSAESKEAKSESLEPKSEDIQYFPGNGFDEPKDSEKSPSQEQAPKNEESAKQEAAEAELPDQKDNLSPDISGQPQQEPIQEAEEPASATNDQIKPELKEEPAEIDKDGLKLVTGDEQESSSEDKEKQPLVSSGEEKEPSSSVASDESLKTPDTVQPAQEGKPEKTEEKNESGLDVLPPEDAQADSYTSLEKAKEQMREKSTSKVSGDRKIAGLIEYICLAIGVAILGFLIYLAIKG